MVSGVRSSWETLAANRRSRVEAGLQPVEHRVEDVGQVFELVAGPGQAETLVQVLLR
jgi:hypothetical protein